ncbi:flagellar basal-body rod protein FlgB [Marinomonas sp. MED121]|uniref:flagellar basal body rod protein FlgB n=1 Tax=Marinomonas sp. MED121 TaxID=314277 RepID=UPI0000690387|nr:flagellar basal body rod protein FlgB [Marinomonas sp. MED121]EAQ66423.1 flagellar basal-body rod protein FlgB [Marinomonas sp. MED121]
MAISFESAFAGHDKFLKFRSDRSAVLANNIANADTPNYKARDISFSSAMSKAQNDALKMRSTNTKHFERATKSIKEEESLFYRVASQPSLDGNTVDLQREQAEFAQNSLKFDTSFMFLDRKISSMKKALNGGR